jgi:ubiquinone/menaquinone biosynthesis C-methylase UbiE
VQSVCLSYHLNILAINQQPNINIHCKVIRLDVTIVVGCTAGALDYGTSWSGWNMKQKIDTVVAHYNEASEQTRLTSLSGQLEYFRTQALIKKYLLKPPANIIDVGGGAGIYALWLASEGYTVDLIDLVPRHIEQALAASGNSEHPLRSASVGDARKLPQEDQTVDTVLLLGPLYHLLELQDRMCALSEAYRVLKPGGLLFAACISRFASLLDGLWRGLVEDPEFIPILEQDLEDGRHHNTTNKSEYFTDAYLQLPDEFENEVKGAGFSIESLSSIEGPAWLLPDLPKWIENAERKNLLMKLMTRIENHRSLLGASAHIMAIARR